MLIEMNTLLAYPLICLVLVNTAAAFGLFNFNSDPTTKTPKERYQFNENIPTTVVGQLHTERRLECEVKGITDENVSWTRIVDSKQLTIDQYVLDRTGRFEINMNNERNIWNLIIIKTSYEDEGYYQCEVSLQNKTVIATRKTFLKILVPKVSIAQGKKLKIKSNTTLSLDCHIENVLYKPGPIFWYKGITLLTSSNNGRIRIKNKMSENVTSSLHIHSVQKSDSGNYYCDPLPYGKVGIDVSVSDSGAGLKGSGYWALLYIFSSSYIFIIYVI